MTYYFRYSDGTILFKKFDDVKEAEWFAHMEGDHLVEWGIDE